MHLFFSSKTLLWFRCVDSSQLCFNSVLFTLLHRLSGKQMVKVKKMQKGAEKPDKDKLLISDVLSVFHTDVHNVPCLLHAALFRLVDLSTHVFSPLTSVG